MYGEIISRSSASCSPLQRIMSGNGLALEPMGKCGRLEICQWRAREIERPCLLIPSKAFSMFLPSQHQKYGVLLGRRGMNRNGQLLRDHSKYTGFGSGGRGKSAY